MFNIENWWTGQDVTEKNKVVIDVGKRKWQIEDMAIFSLSEKERGKAQFAMAKYNRQWQEMLNI